MVEALFCWAVELPPASGACLLTSRWLWKLKEQLSWKKPWATRAVLSKHFLHIPTQFLRQFNCKVSNFIRKPSFHLNPSEMIHWTISLLYISLKPLQSEHISIYFNIFQICRWMSIYFNVFQYILLFVNIFLWSCFDQSTFHPNFFQFWPRQSILPARSTMLLKSIITKLNNKHYHVVFKLFYNPTTLTVSLN